MLDSETTDQLKSVFGVLEHEVELVVELSQHPDQPDLLNLLEGVAETNDKIRITKAVSTPGLSALLPRFRISRNGQMTGVTFTGIPTGHEFTSLIVAILNADGKGKLPDSGLVGRIRRLQGPIDVKTYISLTCENCPDVVQALNQMAFLHPQFKHEMIDGGYTQDDIKKLGIQGVPSVVVGDKLIHSGRITFIDLLEKLEKQFGTNSSTESGSAHLGDFDVVVVGGGPAGASAAIYSARKGLTVALIAEKVGGQVQETRGIENLISVPYTEGPKLAGQLLAHIQKYPVTIFENRRVRGIAENPGGKTTTLDSGETVNAKAIIITTGAKWRELGVSGEKEYIGRGVAFCPHCDGPFYKGKNVAVVGGGNSGVEAAIDLSGIVNELTLIEFASELKADKILVDKLKSLSNVKVIVNAKTQQVVGDGQKVTGLQYQDRQTDKILDLHLDGVFVQIGLVPNSQFVKGLVEMTKFGEIIVDEKGRTSTPGVFAAGDVTTTPYKQIIIAMGEGAKVALAVFESLMFGKSSHGGNPSKPNMA